ncbi:hypothetical protein FHG87_022251, partial [Trinorchestia longiramus]
NMNEDVQSVAVIARNWPLPAFICLGITIYLFLLLIVLWVRRCIVRKTECSANWCPQSSCSDLGLACAEACTPPAICTDCSRFQTPCTCLDTCTCMDTCTACECTSLRTCTWPNMAVEEWWNGRGWCSRWWRVEECSSVDCLCFEISVKGRPP